MTQNEYDVVLGDYSLDIANLSKGLTAAKKRLTNFVLTHGKGIDDEFKEVEDE